MDWIDTARGTSGEDASYAQRFGSVASEDIRILLVQPSVDDDVVCYMSRVPLNGNVMAYSALSYTWGISGATEAIMVQGHPFTVTENLKLLWCNSASCLVQNFWRCG